MPNNSNIQVGKPNNSVPSEMAHAVLTTNEKLDSAWRLRDIDQQKASDIVADVFIVIEQDGDSSPETAQLRARAQVVHSFLLRREMSLGDALVYSLDAAALLKEAEDWQWLGRAYGNLGGIFFHLGMRYDTVEYLYKQLEISIQIEDEEQKATANNNLGMSYMDAGDYAQASIYFEEATRHSALQNSIVPYTYIVTNLAVCWLHLEKFGQARRTLEECLQLTQSRQAHHAESVVWRVMGEMETRLLREKTAISYFYRAQELNVSHGNTYTGILINLAIGRSLFKQALYTSALEASQHALTDSIEIGDKTLTYQAHGLLSEIYAQQNETEKAFSHYRQFHEIKESIFSLKSEQQVQYLKLHHEKKRAQDATKQHDESLTYKIAQTSANKNEPTFGQNRSSSRPEIQMAYQSDIAELRSQTNVLLLYSTRLVQQDKIWSDEQKEHAAEVIKNANAKTTTLLARLQSYVDEARQ